MISKQNLTHHLPTAGFALALLACYFPWIAHPSAALAPNAFDLAEWASLHPAERTGPLSLLTPGLLRAVAAACGVGLASSIRRGWLPGLLVAITLLPPFDFFRGSSADPNFRQMFAIAVFTGGMVVLAARRQTSPAIPAVLGGLFAIVGVARAKALVDGLYKAGIGIGMPLALVGFGLVIVGIVLQPPERTGVASGDGSGVGVGTQTEGREISPTG